MAENSVEKAAEKRRAAKDAPPPEILSALQAERRGYVQRGMDDRAGEVDAYIAQLTGQPKAVRKS